MSRNSGAPEWDQLSIDTPELVSIDLPVAGLGSRFVALVVDYLIWAVVIVTLLIVISLVDPSLSRFSKLGEKWATAIAILIPFLLYWGYFTLFEAFWNGRTPGKRLAKIRVIQVSGRGIGFFESMTRNLVRVVDQFPGFYAVGAICVFLNGQHQRLGDMAAGTLVVHERESLVAASSEFSSRTLTAGIFALQESRGEGRRTTALTPSISAVALQRLGPQDLEVLEGFFARRLDFSMEMRSALAQRIADGVRAKTGMEISADMSVETFLEEVAERLRDVTRLR